MKKKAIMEPLTGRESMLMKCIWDNTEPISAAEIQKKCLEVYDVHLERSTITTFILHLRQKGFVACEKKGQIVYYSAMVKEEDYVQDQTEEFTNFWFKGSLSGLLSAFCGKTGREISQEEKERIQEIIDHLE